MCWEGAGEEVEWSADPSHQVVEQEVPAAWENGMVKICRICGAVGYNLHRPCSQPPPAKPSRPVWRPPRLADWPWPS